MRTLHLLIGTLLLVVQGHAQPSHWPTSNASWKVFHTQAHGLLVWVSPFQLDIINGLLFTEVTYTLGNDTLLGGQQYTAVYQAWDSRFESAPGALVDTTVNYPPQGPVFRGGFRSMGQQVYFWNVQDQSEHLLYDFDLLVGDPLPISFVYQNANATVAEALARLRNRDVPRSLATQAYVVRPPTDTPTGSLIGTVHIQRLLREPPSSLAAASIVADQPDALSPSASLRAVAEHLAAEDLVAAPVCDRNGRLLGAVGVDDVLDALLDGPYRRRVTPAEDGDA